MKLWQGGNNGSMCMMHTHMHTLTQSLPYKYMYTPSHIIHSPTHAHTPHASTCTHTHNTHTQTRTLNTHTTLNPQGGQQQAALPTRLPKGLEGACSLWTAAVVQHQRSLLEGEWGERVWVCVWGGGEIYGREDVGDPTAVHTTQCLPTH